MSTVLTPLPASAALADSSTRHGRTALLGLLAFAALALAGLFSPKWLTFLVTMAAANGLVSLGIVALMRGGVVPFGQGMVFAIGGYTAALLFNKLASPMHCCSRWPVAWYRC